MFLPKIEMKSQHNATKANYALMDQFKSLEVVPFPDYVDSKEEKLPTSSELVIGVIGDISRIKGLDAVLRISREPGEDVGRRKCGFFEVGPRWIQLGPWRICDADNIHLSFSHRDGQTAAIFRSDGTIHEGPRKQLNAWTLEEGGSCEPAEILSGVDFIQVGSWRFGDSGGSFVLAHRSNRTHPVTLVRSRSKEPPGDLWNRPVEHPGNVLVGPEALQIGRWLFLYEEKQLSLAHEQYLEGKEPGRGLQCAKPVSSLPPRGTKMSLNHLFFSVAIVVNGKGLTSAFPQSTALARGAVSPLPPPIPRAMDERVFVAFFGAGSFKMARNTDASLSW